MATAAFAQVFPPFSEELDRFKEIVTDDLWEGLHEDAAELSVALEYAVGPSLWLVDYWHALLAVDVLPEDGELARRVRRVYEQWGTAGLMAVLESISCTTLRGTDALEDPWSRHQKAHVMRWVRKVRR